MDLPSENNHNAPIRPVDQLVLDLLRRDEGLSVTELMEKLEVTATAIRQRLDRLEECSYIERRKHSVGRGRPSYCYFLTDVGWRQVGVTYTDLAMAFWHEVTSIENQQVRDSLVQKVSERMGRSMRERIPDSPLEDRMRHMAALMTDRRVPTDVTSVGGLPVIEVHACPYPDLTAMDHDRSVCDMEQKVFSAALGQAMELSHCRLDGHSCCQFKPVAVTQSG
jgi:predicted ArsR family transcriptional regulator